MWYNMCVHGLVIMAKYSLIVLLLIFSNTFFFFAVYTITMGVACPLFISPWGGGGGGGGRGGRPCSFDPFQVHVASLLF